MRRSILLLSSLLLLPSALLTPVAAQASEPQIVATDPGPQKVREKRERRKDRDRPEPTREREGFMAQLDTNQGAVILPNGDFIPTLRFGAELGAGVKPEVTLGVRLSMVGYLGPGGRVAGGSDLVATGFVRKGLYLRGGAGAISGIPIQTANDFMLPAFGPLTGIGYEFPFAKKGALAVGADYEARVSTRGDVRQAVFFTLRILAYVGKKVR